MIPLPDWYRLKPHPRNLAPSNSPRSRNLAERLLILGAIPMLFVGAAAGGAIASALSSWLMIPGGIIGFTVALGLLGNAGVVCGILETLFYSGFTFLFSDGLEMSNPASAWIKAGAVAALFIWATYSTWKAGDEKGRAHN